MPAAEGPGELEQLLEEQAGLLLVAARIDSEQARFVQVDIFDWVPDRRYDVVFFGCGEPAVQPDGQTTSVLVPVAD
jgi:hypothetical protein